MVEEHVPPASVVGRNLVVPSYFASKRALDRLFWAEREMAAMGISSDPTDIKLTAA